MNYSGIAQWIMHRRWQRSLRAGELPVETQIRQLRWILHHAASTQFGIEHNLESLLVMSDPREAYMHQLEPHDYEYYRPYVERMVGGEKDVLWPGVCRDYAQSSGTSGGRSKYIPITPHSLHLNHYAGATDAVALYMHAYPDTRIFSGKGLILGGSFESELKPADPRVRVGDLSATLISKINPIGNLFRIPEKRVALLGDWEEKLERLAAAAIKSNITNISGVPSWFLRVLRRCLELSGAQTLRELWPDLEVFFHGGISFAPYRTEYDNIVGAGRAGKPAMRYWETYNASEGFFASCTEPGGALTLLMDATVYYEFMDPATEECHLVEDLQPGKTYELVITAPNGLYRYRLGDTITILTTNPVRIRIAGRTKAFINAFGEELMECNAEEAIAAASRETGSSVANYTAGPVYSHDGSKGRHRWLIEWGREPEDIEAFVRSLDTHLRAVNSDYAAKREKDIFLAPPEVVTVGRGTFDRYLSTTGVRKLGGQRKVPRLSNTPEIAEAILGIMNQELGNRKQESGVRV